MSTREDRSMGSDLDLFEPEWHPIVEALVSLEGINVEGGTDISDGLSVGRSIRDGSGEERAYGASRGQA